MLRLALALLALTLAGCRSRPAASAAIAEPLVSDAGPEEWALTPARLDGYLRYQRALLGSDAGSATVEQRAELDERTRAAAGLTVEDVEKTEAMIAALASRRLSARMTGGELPVPLPPPDKDAAPVEKTVAARKALLEASGSLKDERAKFGTTNIDLLLTREKEVLAIWGKLLGLPDEPAKAPAAQK